MIGMSETYTSENVGVGGGRQPRASYSRVSNSASFCCRRRGFTLLELLVVLVILSLVVAVAVPSLGRSTATELKAAARDLVVGLRWTRTLALTKNLDAALSVDVEQRHFQLPGEKKLREFPSGIQITLFTARSELESEARGKIRFFPDGSSTGGRITLSTDRLAYLVDVDWLTGKVRLLDTDPKTVGEAY